MQEKSDPTHNKTCYDSNIDKESNKENNINNDIDDSSLIIMLRNCNKTCNKHIRTDI